MQRGIVIGDTHCGHRTGLTPPQYDASLPDDAAHYARKYVTMRRRLWDWVLREIKAIGEPIDFLIHLGDCIDGRGEKSGSVELIATDREIQCDMAVQVIKTFGAKRVLMVYGTPYHAGAAEDWENQIAKDIGAEEIGAEGHYRIEGLEVAAKHYIGNSSSPISRHTAMTAAQVKQVMWALHGQQPLANLILRGHIHRCYGIADPALNWQGWVCPGLQGLGSKYGTRSMDGLPIHFGFLELVVRGKDDWNVYPHLAPLKDQQAEVRIISSEEEKAIL